MTYLLAGKSADRQTLLTGQNLLYNGYHWDHQPLVQMNFLCHLMLAVQIP